MLVILRKTVKQNIFNESIFQRFNLEIALFSGRISCQNKQTGVREMITFIKD